MLKRNAMRAKEAPKVSTEPVLYGLIAEFDNAEALLAAAEKTRDAGYKKFEAYTPIPIHGLDEAVGYRGTRLPWVIFGAGLLGAAGMFALQTWINLVEYPMNIGGRPLFSWPAFIPATFEGMVLLSAFAAVFGLIAACGLPRPYHPVFNAPNFERASVDRFFLCIEAADPKFELKRTRQFLESLEPLAVSPVDN
ncbi:MAG: DUF3341 domain-containing protein [Roseiflexus sp.]|jgi:hypothetical protein|nr:DUF3341 domain-containing protein [Roseiflexus sp.]MBO9335370.1 DUF3341 domain-containing protein [Roseiflexus sp.]MBO9365055.1 DUF3341 domain-containing protein [Roseiflexus sp.]MBO9389747.1 DUF3341 domain-containing protein [Roseiflexus sp.]